MNKLRNRIVEMSHVWTDIFKYIFAIQGDTAPSDEIRERLLAGGRITGTNLIIMICAIFIACVGLNTDSIAVIIGAMLISPLMGSILAIAYGTVINDHYIIEKHIFTFFLQIIFSVMTATIYFELSPNKLVTAQLIARTQPSFYDVIIALAGGVAGIVGQTRKDKANNIIPGVAIATALMPPLCTCGYALANEEWQMLAGTSYLFIINAYFIYLSAGLILDAIRTPRIKSLTEKEQKIAKFKMIRNTAIVLLPAIIIAITW